MRVSMTIFAPGNPGNVDGNELLPYAARGIGVQGSKGRSDKNAHFNLSPKDGFFLPRVWMLLERVE